MDNPAAKPKIILAEDDPFMVTLLSNAFIQEGFDVIFASNGNEAIARFKEGRPDVLMLDMMMPEKSGLEALRDIRALPGGDLVPAVVLSNLEDPQLTSEAQSLHVAAYLVKSNNQLPEIVAKVKEVLAR